MRISDWSSDVCSSDLPQKRRLVPARHSLIQLEESRHEPATAAGSRRSDHAGRAAFRCRAPSLFREIGRASCRETVCQYVSISVVAVSLEKENDARECLKQDEEVKREITLLVKG